MKIGLVKYAKHISNNWEVYYKTNDKYLNKDKWNAEWFYFYSESHKLNNYEWVNRYNYLYNERLDELLMNVKAKGYIEDYYIITGESVEELVDNIKEFNLLKEII